MNDKPVCRTAAATPGLLKKKFLRCVQKKRLFVWSMSDSKMHYADPGKARGCSTNTVVICSLIKGSHKKSVFLSDIVQKGGWFNRNPKNLRLFFNPLVLSFFGQ